MNNLTSEEIWVKTFFLAYPHPDAPLIADKAAEEYNKRFSSPPAEDKPGLNSVKGECELNRDFETYDNGVRAGIQLGREAMLREVLEYMRSEEAMKMDNAFAERNDCMMDRCLWVIALESKFKGNP